ncbi:MAG: glycerol-3-phosphate dehydrogenase [Sphingobium sp.]
MHVSACSSPDASIDQQTHDLLIVGGGINGTAIARDASGRGHSVLLIEREDLGQHTSSASTKLIHGGLRYLEYGEFRLVRESLIERERLLAMAPHIIWPLSFVLPQINSPRPAWLVRLGLFLYDHLGGRKRLPATRVIARLDRHALGDGLKSGAAKAFVYADCRVEDSRLVILNAMDARERGANIRTRTRLISAERTGDGWTAMIEDERGARPVKARALINAAGPWVADVLARVPEVRSDRNVRLIKGSHIVVPKLYEGDHAFLLQNPDRRVVFVLPYEGEYSLVGTTDQPWNGPPGPASISPEETRYLLASVARYFTRAPGEDDVAWSYAGIRPLYDDHARNASAVTRDYVLDLDAEEGCAPMLSIFGGKITTCRRLAEHALEKLSPFLPSGGGAWTANAVLPGGDLPGGDFDGFVQLLRQAFPALPAPLLRRLARAYGTRVSAILGEAETISGLGRHFGGDLYQAEVDYLAEQEWARTGRDIMFRRSRLGLHVGPEVEAMLDAWLAHRNIA